MPDEPPNLQTTPYAGLTPDAVLDALEGAGLRPDGRLQALDIKVGDTVLYGKWSGTEVKLGGEDHVILKEEDLFGVVG